MKKLFTIKFLAIFLIFSLISVSAQASVSPATQALNAQSLVKLDLLKGYSDGSLQLENKIKRSEFVTLVIRMMGYDQEQYSNNKKIFKDVDTKHWAYKNIGIAINHKLVTGYPDNTFAPDKYVTYAEALTVLVRALGYENTLKGSWPDNVINKSLDLGINTNFDLPQNKQITRGEMSTLVYNSLSVDFNK